MNNLDFTKLSREQLLEYFENERQEWLAAGMSEAGIYRVHFGEENENGRGGLDDVEFNIDFEAAFTQLTEPQRFCFIEVCLKDRTQQSVANSLGVTQQMVVKNIKAAKKKLKMFFDGRL